KVTPPVVALPRATTISHPMIRSSPVASRSGGAWQNCGHGSRRQTASFPPLDHTARTGATGSLPEISFFPRGRGASFRAAVEPRITSVCYPFYRVESGEDSGKSPLDTFSVDY